MADWWPYFCRWLRGGRMAADGRQVSIFLQMASGRQCGCRWPPGIHFLQMASGWQDGCRWPPGIHISADGFGVAGWLQMATRHPYLCRWLWGNKVAADGRLASISPQMAPRKRRPRAGLDGAPPQTPQMGPQPRLRSCMARWMRLDRFQPGRLRPRRPDYRARLNPARCLPAGVWPQAPGVATRVSRTV
jgi:hypothetical protein